MATRAIKPKRDDTMLTGWQSTPELAPSVMLEAKPTLARFLFIVGLLFSAIGTLALLATEWKFPYLVGPSWGLFFLSLGLGLILVHAFVEKDEQFRRTYALTGLMILCLSALIRVLPAGGRVGGWFLTVGYPGLYFGLLLIGAVLRHETNQIWRAFLIRVVLIFAGLILLLGLFFVNAYNYNVVGEGTLLLIMGLVFAMVSLTYQPEQMGYITGMSLGGFGLFCILVGVTRWLAVGIDFGIPSGVILVTMGAVYLAVCLGVVCDWPVVVLTRREFSSFFYSPIAYPVLLGLAVIFWINFVIYVFQIDDAHGPIPEPIVRFYIVSLIPVFAQMFVVPILTMRLLSEEQRDGTLEVMLTAPVNEISVVLSKFIGALGLYLLSWAPMFLFLVSFWVVGGEKFDYRPLLSFFLAVIATGTGFIAMGLFCSAVTRNQIIAAELCFAGMTVHLAIYLLQRIARTMWPAILPVLEYVSFIQLWDTSLEGMVAPRFLFFHISLAIFFLFLTLKVLESRKWK